MLQEVLRPLADEGVAYIYNVVGLVCLLFSYPNESLVEMARRVSTCGQLLAEHHHAFFQASYGSAHSARHCALQLPHYQHGARADEEFLRQFTGP